LAKILLITILLICCYTDLRTRKLYNWATLGGALLGFITNYYYLGTRGLSIAFIGWVTGIIVLIIPYSMGGIGAGDVKLLGAIGAFLGPYRAVQSFLIAAILGGIYAAAILSKQKKLLAITKGSIMELSIFVMSGFQINTFVGEKDGTAAATIPYGLLLSIGALVVFLLGV